MCQVLCLSHLVFHNNPLREFPYSRVPTFKKKKKKEENTGTEKQNSMLKVTQLGKGWS